MRKAFCFMFLIFFSCTAALALAQNSKERYENAVDLLIEYKYEEAGEAFSALGGYKDSPQYAMYCNAIVAGEQGLYSIAVDNLNSLNGFLDSGLLAVYYTGLTWEASEDYESATEVLKGITLYRDVAERIAGYPDLIKARDYRKADANEKAERLEDALSAFKALGTYNDSADRAIAVQEKIYARDYAAADEAERNGDFSPAYLGFIALGNYKDSESRAAVVYKKGFYELATRYALEGKFADAYDVFTELGDYEDSEDKAYVLGVTKFAEVSDRGNGIAAFKFHNLWGLLDVNNNAVIAPYWDEIGEINQFGLAPVTKDDKHGYINTNGDVVIPCEWYAVSEFNTKGLCTVCRKVSYGTWGNEKNFYFFGLYDHSGREITSADWRMLGSSYNYDWDGSFNRDWTTIPLFRDGKIKVQNVDGLYGFIDVEGRLVGEVRWRDIRDFSEDIAVVVENDKYGFIDREGNVIIQPQYADAYSFSNDLAAVKIGSLWQFINHDNDVIIQPRYSKVSSFSNGTADVLLPGTGWQIIDNTGKLIYFIDQRMIEGYQSAMELFVSGKYEEAIVAFEALEGYEDSVSKIEICRASINERDYQMALALQQAGKYKDAIAAFEALNGYRDSVAQIEACQNIIEEREYQTAVALQQQGKYEEAIEAFTTLGNFSDSAKQITETRYLQANDMKKKGDYAGAVEIFSRIKGYKDVNSLLANDNDLATVVAATAIATAAELEAKYSVGNYVTFGHYPQTNGGNDSADIEWLVLARDGKKALLLSRYGLDAQPYNKELTEITWEKCTLRTWLNVTFLNEAFTELEHTGIVLTNVDNSNSQGYWSTSVGNNTQDKIFLLSYAEANKYLSVLDDDSKNTKSRVAPTAYAIKQGADISSKNKTEDGSDVAWWWLRSTGLDQYNAASVSHDGSLVSRNVTYDYGCVRPALWIDLESGIF